MEAQGTTFEELTGDLGLSQPREADIRDLLREIVARLDRLVDGMPSKRPKPIKPVSCYGCRGPIVIIRDYINAKGKPVNLYLEEAEDDGGEWDIEEGQAIPIGDGGRFTFHKCPNYKPTK
jgi:hypothetical protein